MGRSATPRVARRPAENLWRWMDAFIAADLSATVLGVGWRVAVSGKGTSGEDCVVDADDIAAQQHVGRATVYRCLSRMVGDGWLDQTAKPSRGANGERGRRARYRLTIPESCLTTERDSETRSDPESYLTTERDSETRSDPNQVSGLTESCLTAERDRATVLRTYGPTAVLPGPVRQAGSVSNARDDAPPLDDDEPPPPPDPLDDEPESEPGTDTDGGWSLPGPVAAYLDDRGR